MVYNLSNPELASRYKAELDHNFEIASLIGFLVFGCGEVEHQLLRNLSHLLGMKNFENFGIIASGLSVRAAIERIKRAAKAWPGGLGANILALMVHYERRIASARNDLVHNRVVRYGDDLHCIELHNAGSNTNDNPIWPNAIKPPTYKIRDIQVKSLWVRDFANDLSTVADQTWTGGTFEIFHPRTSLPPANAQASGR